MVTIRENSSCSAIGIPMSLFASLDSLQQRTSGNILTRLPTTSAPPTNPRLFRANDTEAMTEETFRRGSPKDKELLALDLINAALAVLEESRTIDERQAGSTAH
mmetsp:Transcript_4173/g.9912  ORF Transcript_4173/g.9912 Transcript_4173/m.9912 type:complete len:104 (+) Transcript_4173:66-377(+)